VSLLFAQRSLCVLVWVGRELASTSSNITGRSWHCWERLWLLIDEWWSRRGNRIPGYPVEKFGSGRMDECQEDSAKRFNCFIFQQLRYTVPVFGCLNHSVNFCVSKRLQQGTSLKLLRICSEKLIFMKTMRLPAQGCWFISVTYQ
jgi:hypothetical protein